MSPEIARVLAVMFPGPPVGRVKQEFSASACTSPHVNACLYSNRWADLDND